MLVTLDPSPNEVHRSEERQLGEQDRRTKTVKPTVIAARIISAATITEITSTTTTTGII